MPGLPVLREAAALAFAAVMAVAALPPATTAPAAAAATGEVRVGPSGLPLPRFVSLKSGKVNARIGPSVNYPVGWLYLKAGLPMEILQEYDTWRKVRDPDGAEGWINQSLLSGKRTAIVAPWQKGKEATVPLLADPRTDARALALLEPGIVGTIRACNGEWCRVTFSGYTGWVSQTMIWGAYPGELYTD